MRTWFVIFCCVSYFSVVTESSSGDTIGSANVLLDKYRAWVDTCRLVEYAFSENFSSFYLDGREIPERDYFYSGAVKFDSHLKRLHFEFESMLGTEKISSDEVMMIRTDDFVIVSLEGHHENGKEGQDAEHSVISYCDKLKMPHNFEGVLGGHVGNPMMVFGIYPMGKKYRLLKISDSFAKMSLGFDQQEWQGRHVYRLIGMDGTDRYELWLDPECGFMPIRIMYQCDSRIDRSDDEYFAFDFQVKSDTVCNNVHVPNSYAVFTDTNYKWFDKEVLKSTPSKEVAHGELTNILIGQPYSDNDFRIKRKIPNYTEVYMQDAAHIQHIWLDGKVVPLTDELALARARGHGFIPGVREPRFWLMTLGIAMILIALGRMAYRYFTGKE